MTTRLKLAEGLTLPLESVTQKLAWLGVTGSGKTYGASKLAELFWHAGAQFVVLDPVGVWYGLRLAKDGKKPSELTVPIFGAAPADTDRIVMTDGRAFTWEEYASAFSQTPDGLNPTIMARVGKKSAGRLLDGREWNEFPEVPHV